MDHTETKRCIVEAELPLQGSRIKSVFAQLGSAAKGAGSLTAYVKILSALHEAAPYDAVQVMRYSRHTAPTYLHAHNTPNDDQELYRGGYYRFDPLFTHLLELNEPAMVHLDVKRIQQEDRKGYFSRFYSRTGMVDEAAYILPSQGNGSVVISFQSRREFTRHELQFLELLLPLVAGVHSSHESALLTRMSTGFNRDDWHRSMIVVDENGHEVYRSRELRNITRSEVGFHRALADLAKSADGSFIRLAHGVLHVASLDESYTLCAGGRVFLFDHGYRSSTRLSLHEAIETFLGSCLTTREREIVRLILLGYPSAAIGGILKVGEGTVRNHRKRIYCKLDITTEREIFSQFVSYLFDTSIREVGAASRGVKPGNAENNRQNLEVDNERYL